MKIGNTGLRLFSRTSGRRAINLAYFHSPHSLTWSWILGVRRQEFCWPRPYAMAHRAHQGPSFGAGLGQMIGCHVRHDNNGRHWSISLLWHSLDWTVQRPMWFRDLYWRREGEMDEERRQRRLARQFMGVDG